MKTFARSLAAACLFAAFAATYSAGAQVQVQQAQEEQAAPTAEQEIDYARVQRLWNTHWRRFAAAYIEHQGNYIYVPGYDRQVPSSAGQSVADFRSDAVWHQPYIDDRGRDTTRRLVLPEEDAHAAVALIPEIAVGQFGYIYSGNISQIIDDQTLEMDRVWLVDSDRVREQMNDLRDNATEVQAEVRQDAAAGRDRGDRREIRRDFSDRRDADREAIEWGFTHRNAATDRQRSRSFTRYTWVVQGYRTAALQADARWPAAQANTQGLQLLIVGIQDTTITAVPAQTLGSGINELQLVHALSLRGIDKPAFVELILEGNRVARNDYVNYVLARVEGLETDEAQAPEDNGTAPQNVEVQLAD